MTAGLELTDLAEAELEAWHRQYPDATWKVFAAEVARLEVAWLTGVGWHPADRGLRPLTAGEVAAFDAVAVAALRVSRRYGGAVGHGTVDNCAGD